MQDVKEIKRIGLGGIMIIFTKELQKTNGQLLKKKLIKNSQKSEENQREMKDEDREKDFKVKLPKRRRWSV